MKVGRSKIELALCLALAIGASACAQYSYRIDGSVAPQMRSMAGLDGGPDRPVGAVVAPDGARDDFIANEIILHPTSHAELDAFVSRYGGTIVRDGTAHLLPGESPPDELPPDSGWYLIRIDPSTSTLEDFATNLDAAGLSGEWVFSSEDAARLSALALRERAKELSPNFLATLDQSCQVCEHPTVGGGNLDAADWWWMTEDDDPAVAGEQGLSIGVIHAWEYLKYQGYPREGVPYVPVKVAVLDTGFDLDTTSGVPLNGNQDYFYSPPKPLQLDEVEGDWTAGGPGSGFANCNGCWHGQMTFGVCCAFARNSWGTAGISGGSDIKTLLIKVSGDLWIIASGVYDALYNNAHVINMSIDADCGSWCHTFQNGNVLKAVVGSARNVGAIVVSAAGNQGEDISGANIYPCSLSGSICVGAIDRNANAQSYSNWGSVLDIWAPAGIRSTVTRNSAASDATTTNDNLGIDELHEFHGTSCASPFVAGVVAMMKMLNGNLYHSKVEKILANTALNSPDTKVSQGYIDAFAVVEAARPNKPPTIEITKPPDGATTGYTAVWLVATVKDPEKPNAPYVTRFPTTLAVRSDKDGLLCTDKDVYESKGCDLGLLSLGTHTITGTASDAFGATATDSITITVANTAPTAKIKYPADGASYYVSQSINLRGLGFDADQASTPSLKWMSNISGHLGDGNDIWVTLPAGSHKITLTAKDGFGVTGTDSITLAVKEGKGYPTAKILKPASNSVFTTGTPTMFVGKGTDPEDGTLTGASLRWSSNHDGFLGTGKSLTRTLSGPSCGMRVHDITLEVTDSTGRKDTHKIKVSVGVIC